MKSFCALNLSFENINEGNNTTFFLTFHYTPGSPATFHDPGSDTEVEIISISLSNSSENLLNKLSEEEVLETQNAIEEYMSTIND